MRVLIVGGGGREHALAVGIARSKRLTKLYAAPGNPGIAQVATCVDLAAEDLEGLLRFAREEKIDLTVVGPEGPLVKGIVDLFEKAGLLIFGPSRSCARLEGSKAFTKELCRKHHIPTAAFRTFFDAETARGWLRESTFPQVLKADGLAAGKGVVIARSYEEADEAIQRFMIAKDLGEAGSRLVIEEFMQGVESSVLAMVDGRTIAVLETARDHKTALDDNRGPNTGGMGTCSPSAAMTPELLLQVESQILLPAVHAMGRDGKGFKGFLYAGVMITPGGPKLLEFNVRMGDPEAQVIFPRLRSDLLELLHLSALGRLEEAEALEWDSRPAVCVVLASNGYPGPYAIGYPIFGLDDAARDPDVQIFHAGTRLKGADIVTAGGRVLGVTALGATVVAARETAYAAVSRIRFQGASYRSDIGRLDAELLEGR
jgi:phosphoribosylamine---glycine ligase